MRAWSRWSLVAGSGSLTIQTTAALQERGFVPTARCYADGEGVARHHGRLANGPSGQDCRWRSPSRLDGMPSVQAGPSVQPLVVSQLFGPLNGVILQDPDPTACRRVSL
jgi:hypothetical protein